MSTRPDNRVTQKRIPVSGIVPTFLIVGAARSGTTSLYEYIRQHPEAFMPAVKEPHYFFCRHGMDWDSYRELFVDGEGKKAVGEASAGYLYSPETPKRIREELGGIQIIVLLRNPAERAFSLYTWMVMEGYEDSTTFQEALNREPERLKSETFRRCLPHPQLFPDYLYHTTGLYHEQVRRYYDTFGRDHVGVWLFEELTERPLEVCAQVFEFLNIDSRYQPHIRAHNAGRRPRSVTLQFWLRKYGQEYMRRSVVGRAMRMNLRCGHRPRKPYTVLSDLAEYYRDNVRRLQELIGRDLSQWIE